MKYIFLLLIVFSVSCQTKTAKEYFELYEQSFQKEDFNSAAEYLRLVIKLEPENPQYYLLRSDCFSHLEKYENAISDLDALIEKGYGSVLEYYNRGIFKINLKDYDGVIADFESAYKDQEYIDCLYQIGRIYNLKSDYKKTKLDKFSDSFSNFLTIKLNALSTEIQVRFNDTIANLIEKAKKIDNLDSSIKNLKKREQLIVKYEKLFEIDKLINDLNL